MIIIIIIIIVIIIINKWVFKVPFSEIIQRHLLREPKIEKHIVKKLKQIKVGKTNS